MVDEKPSSDIAFTPSVKAVQTARGSRAAYARKEANGAWPTRVTPELAAFLAGVRSFYLATASAAGQPYLQHRGGPPGFLRVLDDRTLGFADFRGNRQYITSGNLAENPRAFIFVMDYAQRQRIKLWGTARTAEVSGELADRLLVPDYPARIEQAILFTLDAWDVNCPQHIPQLVPYEEVTGLIGSLKARIEELEEELRGSAQRS